ncbi:MAG TPA: hypothetical protein DCG38_07880 [Eubacteriaceae bacterium]|nr:hypothetical protein [Eubacteriaceae bacterium]
MIKIGDRGVEVKKLQNMMVRQGYLKDEEDIDSIFGPKTKKAVTEFQKDYGLKIDGIVGAETSREIMFLKYPNFSSKEFRCKCNGKYCNGFPRQIDEDLIAVLQRIRNKIGMPIVISSGLRCPRHNNLSGGVRDSLHLRGKAADIKAKGISVRDLGKVVVETNTHGGCGISYESFVHLDTGAKRMW